MLPPHGLLTQHLLLLCFLCAILFIVVTNEAVIRLYLYTNISTLPVQHIFYGIWSHLMITCLCKCTERNSSSSTSLEHIWLRVDGVDRGMFYYFRSVDWFGGISLYTPFSPNSQYSSGLLIGGTWGALLKKGNRDMF